MKKLFRWLGNHFMAIVFGLITVFLAAVGFLIPLDIPGTMTMLFVVFLTGLATWFFATGQSDDEFEYEPDFDNGKETDLSEIDHTISDLTAKVALIEKEISDMKTAYNEIARLMDMQESKHSEYYKYLSDNAKSLNSSIKKTVQMRDKLNAQLQMLEGKQSELAATSVMAFQSTHFNIS